MDEIPETIHSKSDNANAESRKENLQNENSTEREYVRDEGLKNEFLEVRTKKGLTSVVENDESKENTKANLDHPNDELIKHPKIEKQSSKSKKKLRKKIRLEKEREMVKDLYEDFENIDHLNKDLKKCNSEPNLLVRKRKIKIPPLIKQLRKKYLNEQDFPKTSLAENSRQRQVLEHTGLPNLDKLNPNNIAGKMPLPSFHKSKQRKIKRLLNEHGRPLPIMYFQDLLVEIGIPVSYKLRKENKYIWKENVERNEERILVKKMKPFNTYDPKDERRKDKKTTKENLNEPKSKEDEKYDSTNNHQLHNKTERKLHSTLTRKLKNVKTQDTRESYQISQHSSLKEAKLENKLDDNDKLTKLQQEFDKEENNSSKHIKSIKKASKSSKQTLKNEPSSYVHTNLHPNSSQNIKKKPCQAVNTLNSKQTKMPLAKDFDRTADHSDFTDVNAQIEAMTKQCVLGKSGKPEKLMIRPKQTNVSARGLGEVPLEFSEEDDFEKFKSKNKSKGIPRKSLSDPKNTANHRSMEEIIPKSVEKMGRKRWFWNSFPKLLKSEQPPRQAVVSHTETDSFKNMCEFTADKNTENKLVSKSQRQPKVDSTDSNRLLNLSKTSSKNNHKEPPEISKLQQPPLKKATSRKKVNSLRYSKLPSGVLDNTEPKDFVISDKSTTSSLQPNEHNNIFNPGSESEVTSVIKDRASKRIVKSQLPPFKHITNYKQTGIFRTPDKVVSEIENKADPKEIPKAFKSGQQNQNKSRTDFKTKNLKPLSEISSKFRDTKPERFQKLFESQQDSVKCMPNNKNKGRFTLLERNTLEVLEKSKLNKCAESSKSQELPRQTTAHNTQIERHSGFLNEIIPKIQEKVNLNNLIREPPLESDKKIHLMNVCENFLQQIYQKIDELCSFKISTQQEPEELGKMGSVLGDWTTFTQKHFLDTVENVEPDHFVEVPPLKLPQIDNEKLYSLESSDQIKSEIIEKFT